MPPVVVRDPTTGAEIAGVVCTNFVIYASEGEDRTLTEEPFHTIYLSQADGDLARNPADFGGPGIGQEVLEPR